MKSRLPIVVLLIAVALAGVGVYLTLASLNSGDIAEVNGHSISREEFYSELEREFGSYLLAQMIRTKLLQQEAYVLGVEVDDAAVQSEIDEVKAYYGVATDRQLEVSVILPQYGISLDQFKEHIRLHLIVDAIRLHGVDVSSDDAMRFYAENREDYYIEDTMDIKHLLVPTREQALAARERILAGEAFDAVAMEVSTDPGKNTVGVLYRGVSRGTGFDPDFVEAGRALEIGELSQPVETRFGYHIMEVVARNPARYMEYSEVKDEIMAELREARAVPHYEIIERLVGDADISILSDQLRQDVLDQLGVGH